MEPTYAISRPVRMGLHFVVAWPGTPYQYLRIFVWMITLIIVQACQCRYVVACLNSIDILYLVDAVSITLAYTTVWFKLLVFWTKQGAICKILTTMIKERQKYATLDSNNLIARSAYLTHRITGTLIASAPVTVFLYAIGVLLSGGQIGEDGVASQKSIIKMKLPLESYESPVYELILMIQFVHMNSVAISGYTIDAALLSMILHVGCQIDIMCERFTEITFNDKRQLRYLIRRHQEIIAFVESIENLYNYIALMQFVLSTFIICCVGFLILISIGTEQAFTVLVKCFMFYIAVIVDAFVYCFAGEYLNAKSKMIGDAAYESFWYELHPAQCQTLLLLILRSQKNLTLTIGKFSNLSFNTFATVMKASASYISVLLAMS